MPAGVKKYGHKSVSKKGSKHPAGVNSSGPDTVDKLGGSPPRISRDFATSPRSVVPSGVVRGDGTEKLRGTKVKHLQAKNKMPSGGKADKTPPGVRKHSGLKASKRIK